MGAVGVVAALATVVAVVLLFGGGGSGAPKRAHPDDGSNADAAAGMASIKDIGPVTVITEDPSCAAWTTINNELGPAARFSRTSETDRYQPRRGRQRSVRNT